MGSEDEDPIVKEMPVYLSKSLSEQLYLFQYPVRPAKKPYDYSVIQSARVKIKQQKIEMELPVQTRSAHYDKSKGEQFALNVDGREAEASNAYFRSDLMDKQVLASTHGVVNTSNYAICAIKDGELHLTPLKGVLQVRPSFSYLDKSDSRIQKSVQADGGEASQDEEEPEATTITVKFARRETDRVKQAREKSYAFLQEKLSEEPWKNLTIYSATSHNNITEYSKLLCNSPNSDSSVYFNVKPEAYLSQLLPKIVEKDFVKPEMPRNILSMTQLRTMPVTDQVRSLLINSKLIKMSQLMALLPPDIDAQIVLRALQQVAMLVQGCWVVKSEVLYPKKTMSAHSGVPSEILCRARDYVMWCFTQNRYIIRKDVHAIVKLPQEDMKEILEQISHLKMNKGWEFIIPFDSTFVKRYPDTVQRQQMLWEAKYSSLCKSFNISPSDDKFKGGKPQTPPRPRRRRRTKSGHSTSGDESSGTDGMKRIPKMIAIKQEPLSPIKNASNDNINTNRYVDSNPMVDEVSTVRFVPSAQMKTELANFINEVTASYPCVNVPQIRRLLNNKLTESPPGHILSTGVSDSLLHQSLHDCGGERHQFKWLPENETVYAFYKENDPHEKLRKNIIESYQASEKHRLLNLKKKVEENIGRTIEDSEFKSILKDYTEFKSGYYYFRTATS